MYTLTIFVMGLVSAHALDIKFTKAPYQLPCRLSGSTAAKIGGEGDLLLFGGYEENKNTKQRVASNKVFRIGRGRVEESLIEVEGRLCAAAASLENKIFVSGGWAPPREGKMSDDHFADMFDVMKPSRIYPGIPVGTSSRHVLLKLPSHNSLLLHNHRTTNRLYTFNGESWEAHEALNPPMPSRGLHVACALPNGDCIFALGSSSEMMNDAWVLSTSSSPWRWNEVAVSGEKPTPRAGSVCFPVGNDGMAVFGGAENTNTGLRALNDLWHLKIEGGGVDGGYKGVWTRIDEVEGEFPPPRNAATITRIEHNKFVMTGGWRPFVETYDDIWEINVYQ